MLCKWLWWAYNQHILAFLVMSWHLTLLLVQTKNTSHFVSFLGSTIFREITIYGATSSLTKLKTSSFTWIFETFLAAHNGKQPKTIYTCQDVAMGKAIKNVFTESYHGLCTFHIMQKCHQTFISSEGLRRKGWPGRWRTSYSLLFLCLYAWLWVQGGISRSIWHYVNKSTQANLVR